MLDFSNTTTQIGLIQKCEVFTGLGRTGISGNADLLKQFTGLLNDELGTFVGDALDADGRWQFDDFNHLKQPVATFDLVANQAVYTFTVDEQSNQILRLAHLAVKDPNGEFIRLTPTDLTEFTGRVSYEEFESTSGTPRYFDISDGVGVRMFPAPNYDSTEGGLIYYQREPSYFASGDTTKKPGLPGTVHIGLAYGASAVWLMKKDSAAAAKFLELREQKRQELRSIFSRRNKFEQPQLRAKRRSSR